MIAFMFGFLKRLFRRSTSAEKHLRSICHGDLDQMKRLIAFEKDRKPGLSEQAAIRSAVTRYKRDH